MRSFAFLFTLLACLNNFGFAKADTYCKNRVDLALVLAIDVSSSINKEEWQLQKQGYMRAFLDKEIVLATRSGRCGRIAVCVIEWGDANYQEVVIPWRLLSDSESATAFSLEFSRLEHSELYSDQTTYIGNAILSAIKELALKNVGFTATRRLIDVSGDGTDQGTASRANGDVSPETHGLIASEARDEAAELGIIINGLPILGPDNQNLDDYYQDNVKTPDGFIKVAERWEDFGQAIREKLLQEINVADAR